MSRAGRKITWILCDKPNPWGLLIDDKLDKPCLAIKKVWQLPQPQAKVLKPFQYDKPKYSTC